MNEIQFPGDMAMGPDSWSTQTLMRHNRRDDRGRVGGLACVCMAECNSPAQSRNRVTEVSSTTYCAAALVPASRPACESISLPLFLSLSVARRCECEAYLQLLRSGPRKILHFASGPGVVALGVGPRPKGGEAFLKIALPKDGFCSKSRSLRFVSQAPSASSAVIVTCGGFELHAGRGIV